MTGPSILTTPTWWMAIHEWEARAVIDKFNLRKVTINHDGFDTIWYRPFEEESRQAIPIVRLHLNGVWEANMDSREWSEPPKKPRKPRAANKPKEKYYRVHFKIEGYEQGAILDVPYKLFVPFVDSIDFIPVGKHLVSLMAVCMFSEVSEKMRDAMETDDE